MRTEPTSKVLLRAGVIASLVLAFVSSWTAALNEVAVQPDAQEERLVSDDPVPHEVVAEARVWRAATFHASPARLRSGDGFLAVPVLARRQMAAIIEAVQMRQLRNRMPATHGLADRPALSTAPPRGPPVTRA